MRERRPLRARRCLQALLLGSTLLAPPAHAQGVAPAPGEASPGEAASPAEPPARPEGSGPWRLARLAGLPDWLDVGGTHRARLEALERQFRAGGEKGGDRMLALRTTLRVAVDLERLCLLGELMDSRQELSDRRSPLDTTMVDAVELVQAYLALRFEVPLLDDGPSELRLGRQTIDLGSRRLLARNDFRNTTNFFTGLHWQWRVGGGPTLRAFYVLPVNREPADAPSLLENEVELDRESLDLRLWGLHVEQPGLLWGAAAELYVLGLHERDSEDRPTRNRRLYTPGVRLSRKPSGGTLDFDLEGVAQLGTQRGSAAASDTRDLDHLAFFVHGELGYTLETHWSPRAALLYDHASGDESPRDGDSNRFDTLFGARRFEHGPTGIYGAFARSNIHAPGLRLSARPLPGVELMAAYRPYWLASATDAWTTAGLRDPSGRSGSFVGHQVEARVRWDPLPGNLRLEAGGAYLAAGEFMRDAPNANGGRDTFYGYASLELQF